MRSGLTDGVAAFSTAAFLAAPPPRLLPRLRSRAIMRALSDDYAPPPSPPSEDAVVVLGARLDEEPLSVEQEILMSLAIIELALGVLVLLGVLFACAYVAGFRKRRPVRLLWRLLRQRRSQERQGMRNNQEELTMTGAMVEAVRS